MPGVSVPGVQGGDSGVGGGRVALLEAAAGGGHQHAGARLQADLEQPPAATSAVTHIHQQGGVLMWTPGLMVFKGLQGQLS